MIPRMHAHRAVPLVAVLLALSLTLRASGAQTVSTRNSPAAVVDSFFRAAEQERWRDAARLMDLETFGDLRDQTVRMMRGRRTAHHVTPEELMKFDPKMPRVVAEYEAARSNEQVASYNGVSQEYANVPNVDSLAALSVEEAAARWLQARDPRYQMRRSLERERSRCNLPDSVVTGLLLQAPATTAQVLGTVLEDTLAYVLYAEMPARKSNAESVTARTRHRESSRRSSWVISPPLLTLRRMGSRWRIAPGEPFGGWSGYASVIDCPATGTGESSPPRSP